MLIPWFKSSFIWWKIGGKIVKDILFCQNLQIKWFLIGLIFGGKSNWVIVIENIQLHCTLLKQDQLFHGATTEGASLDLVPPCPWNPLFLLSTDWLTSSACCSFPPWASQSWGRLQPPARFLSPAVLPGAMLKGWREVIFSGRSGQMSDRQDHTSQDHFCSVIDEFPVWNSESIKPRGWDLVSSPEREAGWEFFWTLSSRWSLTVPL